MNRAEIINNYLDNLADEDLIKLITNEYWDCSKYPASEVQDYFKSKYDRDISYMMGVYIVSYYYNQLSNKKNR